MLALAFALMIGDSLGPSPRIPWIGLMDYPAALLEERKEGIVEVELTFNAAGRLTSCNVLASSGAALLDRTTCLLSHRRARAKPGDPRVQVHRHVWVAPSQD